MDSRHSALYPDAKHEDTLLMGAEYVDFVRGHLLPYGINIITYASKKYQYGAGEGPGGIEVKKDNHCSKTQRLSIEIAEKSRAQNAQFVPSGIYRDDNTWLYIQGNEEIIFVFARSTLQLLHKSGRYTKGTNLPTIKTFYIPFEDAYKYAALVIQVSED